ncbi:MAG: DGQHR domain-containing protein, partial [Myxococcota bacterium]
MTVMEIPALALEQSPGRHIFAFGVDGKVVPQFASISRARRDEEKTDLMGYQRPEVNRHIAEIRGYLESEGSMIPNAIVLAFDPRVEFIAHGPAPSDRHAQSGTLRIPIAEDGDEKVGWVVDGQQRLAAIREARLEGFPIFAVGFVAQSEAEHREQFLLV